MKNNCMQQYILVGVIASHVLNLAKLRNLIMRQAKIYFCTSLILCSLWLAASQTGTGSLSVESQQELLNAHNFFRGIVNPPASNMERMVR